MQKKINFSGKKKVLSFLITLTVAMTFIVISASADTFGQNGDVFTTNYFTTDEFSTGNDTHLTVSARAITKYGSPTYVRLILQKYGTFGWGNVDSYDLTVDLSQTTNVWRNLTVPKNTKYRILCKCFGPNATDVATLYLGIGTWS